MQTKQSLTEKQKKQRKFFLVLPALVLPFITCLLWAIGIIGESDAKASGLKGGLNMKLPDAHLTDNNSWNKLSFYEQAEKDSAKYREALKNDPFFQKSKDSVTAFSGVGNSPLSYNSLPPGYQDANEYRVNQRLAKLNEALNANSNVESASSKSERNVLPQSSSIATADVNRLENMLQNVNQNDSDSDPETQQLNSMMDKILDIQHPERVSDRIQRESAKNSKQVFPVVLDKKSESPSLLQKGNSDRVKTSPKGRSAENGFYSLGADTLSSPFPTGIEADIQETQTIVGGSSVKLVLGNDIYVNGTVIPMGTFIYGTASQNDERLKIEISSIRYQSSIFPVSLSVYDLDGLEGIHIPGSLNRDVAKETGSEGLSNIGITSLDPSLGAQAASAGIAAAKTLINKKVKQVKLTVKAGYKVILNDNNHQ